MRNPYGIATVVLFAAVSVYFFRATPGEAAPQESAANDKTKSNKAEEKPVSGAGSGVVMSATLKSGSFSNGQVRGPAYNVKMVVKNYTAVEQQLGETLVVIEKEQASDNFASSYVSRAGASATPKEKDGGDDPLASAFSGRGAVGLSTKRRYQLDWGQDINQDGSSFQVFRAGGTISLSFSSPGAYRGLGWGRVSAHAERTMEVELPFPYKVKGAREYLAIVLPSARGRAAAPGPAVTTILKFEPEGANPETGFKLAETIAVPMRAADLQAIATNKRVDAWRRVFALNWLVETAPKSTTALLVETLTGADTPAMLKMSAGLDLAMLKSKDGVQPLLSVLASAPDDKVRWWSIQALGEIGDTTAAPAIRPYLTHADDDTARNAIEAAGKLKDAEAVTPLLAILADKKHSNRHDAAGTALSAIGNPAAVQGLLEILNDSKSGNRALAADKLGSSGAAEAVPPLVAISADTRAKEDLRKKAIASLGKLGGAGALAALQAAAESDQAPLRSAALSALAGMKDPAAVTALIGYAEKTGYASREEAVSELSRDKKTEALPALRKLVSDKQAPGKVRQKACDALKKMEDKQGIAALQSALDDSDKDVYHDALIALHSISAKDAAPADLAALKSVHAAVRRLAAEHIKEAKPPGVAAQLWTAYQAEQDESAGSNLADALVALKFADQSAVPFLLGRIDPKTNKLWYSDVELLRQISGQKFGPANKYTDKKERDAELDKWRQWGESRK